MEHLLPDWLPRQRWFGAKGRPIEGVRVLAERELISGDPAMRHVLAEVDLGEDKEIYQLLVGVRSDLPERLRHAHIGEVGSATIYDAAHDAQLTHVLLQMLARNDDENGLRFRHLPDADLDTDLTSLVMKSEQSNTSLVYGERYILKLFRKV